jgi:hypothetical protein
MAKCNIVKVVRINVVISRIVFIVLNLEDTADRLSFGRQIPFRSLDRRVLLDHEQDSLRVHSDS